MSERAKLMCRKVREKRKSKRKKEKGGGRGRKREGVGRSEGERGGGKVEEDKEVIAIKCAIFTLPLNLDHVVCVCIRCERQHQSADVKLC